MAALLLLAGIATFTVLHVREQRTVMARAEAQAVAKEAVPVLLSFDHTSLGGDLASREARLTGSFKDDYAKLMRDVVLPAAQQSVLITTTELVDSGVAADDGPNRITLLMFVNQSTGPEGRAPDVAGSRVRVTMERPADEWLVSELTPV
ncbi:hypothetical protein [Pseudonocardia xishanensis]|uniref:hypothetical protein n=1 Tax=Pseudonocardia xishanensis TaxID=630995 RepID=UPI0031E816E1